MIRTNRNQSRNTKNILKEEIEEVQEAHIDTEYCCINCDNFPGCGPYPPSQFASLPCPFKLRFVNEQLNEFTNPKDINCPNFYN